MATSVVVDASVVVRGLTAPGAAAARLEQLADGRAQGVVPDLLYAEVANALARYVRAGTLEAGTAAHDLEWVRSLPLQAIPCRELGPAALAAALARGVTAYDAMYLVLAEATECVLVTADRRLAAAAERSELVPD